MPTSLPERTDGIRAYVAARQASANQALKDQAQSHLVQTPKPPAEFAQVYSDLGLNTNQDVLDKGPTYVNNLVNDVNQGYEVADRLREDGEKGADAAEALGALRQKIDSRIAKMNSVENSGALPNGPGNVARAPAGAGRSDAGPLLSAGTSVGLEPGVSGEGKVQGESGLSARDGEGIGTGASARASSLRDALKRSLSRTKSEQAGGGDQAETARRAASKADPPASVLSTFFGDTLGKTSAPGSGGGADFGGSQEAAFKLSGAETDREIGRAHV